MAFEEVIFFEVTRQIFFNEVTFESDHHDEVIDATFLIIFMVFDEVIFNEVIFNEVIFNEVIFNEVIFNEVSVKS